MGFLYDNWIVYVAPFLGVVGLFFMFLKSSWVSKQDPGDEKMTELSDHIAKGAMAFLMAEWRVLGVFSIIAAALLLVHTLFCGCHSNCCEATPAKVKRAKPKAKAKKRRKR